MKYIFLIRYDIRFIDEYTLVVKKKKIKLKLKCCGSKLYKGARCICYMESTKINHNISLTTTDSNKIYSPDSDKNNIIQMFNSNLKGKKYVKNTTNTHDGAEGHFIETQMGILINSNNAPDNLDLNKKRRLKYPLVIGRKFIFI